MASSNTPSTFSKGKRKSPVFVSYCHVAQDLNLSIQARGLLFYYLSFPEGWTHHFEKIRKDNGIGKDKLQSLNKELQKNGYMISWQEKNEKGFWGSHHYEIFDDKQEASDRMKELESQKAHQKNIHWIKEQNTSHNEYEPLPENPAAGKQGALLSTKVDKYKTKSKKKQESSNLKKGIPKKEEMKTPEKRGPLDLLKEDSSLAKLVSVPGKKDLQKYEERRIKPAFIENKILEVFPNGPELDEIRKWFCDLTLFFMAEDLEKYDAIKPIKNRIAYLEKQLLKKIENARTKKRKNYA